jgi:hypothetical protein
VLLLQFVIVRPILNLLYAMTEMNGEENVSLRVVKGCGCDFGMKL